MADTRTESVFMEVEDLAGDDAREFLPGNTWQRMKDLRIHAGLRQEDLAREFGVDKSTINRLEKGSTTQGIGDWAVKYADYFDVSTDFIFGRTDYPNRRDYSIESLGISPRAAEAIAGHAVNIDILNSLLEDPVFCEMTYYILCCIYQNTGQFHTLMETFVSNEYALLSDVAKIFPKDEREIMSALNCLKNETDNPAELEEYRVRGMFDKVMHSLHRNHDEAHRQQTENLNDVTGTIYEKISRCTRQRRRKGKQIMKVDMLYLAGVEVDAVRSKMNLSDGLAKELKNVFYKVLEEQQKANAVETVKSAAAAQMREAVYSGRK